MTRVHARSSQHEQDQEAGKAGSRNQRVGAVSRKELGWCMGQGAPSSHSRDDVARNNKSKTKCESFNSGISSRIKCSISNFSSSSSHIKFLWPKAL